MEEELYTPDQVAKLLGVKVSRIRKHLKCGELASIWLWDKQYVLHSQLGDYLIKRLKSHRDSKPKVIRSRKNRQCI